jgi:hypothetical protein
MISSTRERLDACGSRYRSGERCLIRGKSSRRRPGEKAPENSVVDERTNCGCDNADRSRVEARISAIFLSLTRIRRQFVLLCSTSRERRTLN